MAKKYIYLDNVFGDLKKAEAEMYELPDYVTTPTANAPIILNGAGKINQVLIDDTQILHGGLSGLADDDHTQYLRVDGTRALSGELDLGLNKLTHVADASLASDLINKAQLDFAVAGLQDFRESVIRSDLSDPPSTPNVGDRYIIASGSSNEGAAYDVINLSGEGIYDDDFTVVEKDGVKVEASIETQFSDMTFRTVKPADFYLNTSGLNPQFNVTAAKVVRYTGYLTRSGDTYTWSTGSTSTGFGTRFHYYYWLSGSNIFVAYDTSSDNWRVFDLSAATGGASFIADLNSTGSQAGYISGGESFTLTAGNIADLGATSQPYELTGPYVPDTGLVNVTYGPSEAWFKYIYANGDNTKFIAWSSESNYWTVFRLASPLDLSTVTLTDGATYNFLVSSDWSFITTSSIEFGYNSFDYSTADYGTGYAIPAETSGITYTNEGLLTGVNLDGLASEFNGDYSVSVLCGTYSSLSNTFDENPNYRMFIKDVNGDSFYRALIYNTWQADWYVIRTDKNPADFVDGQNIYISSLFASYVADSSTTHSSKLNPLKTDNNVTYLQTFSGGSAASGDWSGHEKEITEWNGTSWFFEPRPDEGTLVYDENENTSFIFNSNDFALGQWVIYTQAIIQAGDGILIEGNTVSLRLGQDLEFFGSQAQVNAAGLAGVGLQVDGLNNLGIDFANASFEMGFNLAVSALDLSQNGLNQGSKILGFDPSSVGFTNSPNIQGALESFDTQLTATELGGVVAQVGLNGVNRGDLVYYSSVNTVETKTDITSPEKGIALAWTTEAFGATVILIQNNKKMTGVLTGASSGEPVYWDGAGLTLTAPTGNGRYVYRVGYAINTTDLFVNVEYLKRNQV